MLKEEFEKAYAKRSGMTVAQLRRLGRIVIPAERDIPRNCDDPECEGWHSVSRHEIEWEIREGIRPESDKDLLV